MAKKKIYPTIWWLFRDRLLPINTRFYGYSRSAVTIEEIRRRCESYMKVRPTEAELYEEFWKLNVYIAGNYDSRSDFERLNQEINLNGIGDTANRIFYLALPPSVFESVTVHLNTTCISKR